VPIGLICLIFDRNASLDHLEKRSSPFNRRSESPVSYHNCGIFVFEILALNDVEAFSIKTPG
jgi:hypothetical protein